MPPDTAPPAGAPGPVSHALRDLIEQGVLRADADQVRAARVLDRVASQVVAAERDSAWWARMLRPRAPRPRGAYLVGDVGRGKTMLMDLFFSATPMARKRRVHFHEFMDEMHAGIANFRSTAKGRNENADPVAAVTRGLLKDVRLLCLDEFHVQDITNAMLLGRLFEQVFAGGVVLVATSNVPPERLYENGLNRQLFVPFIAMLQRETELVALSGPDDYRRFKYAGEEVFWVGEGDDARAHMDALWLKMTGGVAGGPASVASLGRTIPVPRAAMGAARFPAAALLDAALGARDYLRIAHQFDALMLDDVPRFTRTNSDAAKRFILLVDTLYDRGTRLAASFAVPLEQLADDEQTRFEFARTLSRLQEMRSLDYLEAPLRRHAETKG